MTLTIGRTSGLRPDKATPTHSGNGVRISGTIMATSTDDLNAVRQQLLGLIGNADEDVFPLVWTTDPTFDGFYRVLSMSVERIGPVGSKRATFSTDLVRVTGYSAPLIELDALGVVRTNGVGITSGEPIAISQVYHESAMTYTGNGGSGLHTRTGEDGDVYLPLDTTPFQKLSQAFPSIANRYEGMCSIEVKYGSTWYPVVGRQVPSAAAGNWRISNGIVRFTYATYAGVAGTRGGLLVEVFTGGAWRTTVTMKQGNWTGAAYDESAASAGIGDTASPNGAIVAAPLRVLRNSPETVVIAFDKGLRCLQYLTLQAGAAFCTLATRQATGSTEYFIRPVAAETAAALGSAAPFTYDPGVARSTNDANGNRYALFYTYSNVWFLQDGGIRTGAARAAGSLVEYAIGVVIGGSGAVTNDKGTDLALQYLGQAQWRQRVVVS